MITFKVTKFFFDRAAVQAAVGVAKARNLAKAGAFVRRAARSSMRKRKAVAAPGSPPSAHQGEPNLRTIVFAWDPQSESMVIGPVGFNALSVQNGVYVKGTVPQVNEFGGTVGITEVQRKRDGTWDRADLRSRRRLAGRPMRVRQATYPARPFMFPALQQEGPKFVDLWKDSVVRGG